MHSLVNVLLASATLASLAHGKPLHSLHQRAPVAVTGYDYIGCYTDRVGLRTFSGKTYIDDAMTAEKCAAACTGFTYFGMEYGREVSINLNLHTQG